MSSELDVPFAQSAETIRRRMFASVRQGFDPDQVREYLREIAAHFEQLERSLRAARLGAENARSEAQGAIDAANRRVEVAERRVAEVEAQRPPDAYQDVSSRMAEVLRAADEQSQKLLAEGRVEANRLIAEARVESDQVRGEAQVRAEEARKAGDDALRRARSEADRANAALDERRTVLVTQLQEMQARLMGVAQDLDSTVIAMEPGLWLQRITTKTADEGQGDVAIDAFGGVVRLESDGPDTGGRATPRRVRPDQEASDLRGGGG